MAKADCRPDSVEKVTPGSYIERGSGSRKLSVQLPSIKAPLSRSKPLESVC